MFITQPFTITSSQLPDASNHHGQSPPVAVVHEDEELLVVNKPAGLVCHPTKGDAFSSLIGRLRLYLGSSAASGTDGTPHLVNRLDRETSGLVLIAKSKEAAGELGRLWSEGAVRKQYLAIVHGVAPAEPVRIVAPLGKDTASMVAIKHRVCPDGAAAATSFRRLSVFSRGAGQFSLLRVHPETGRKHQIRIHLAHAGFPIVGDKIYGPDERCYLDFVTGSLTARQRELLILEHQALHAEELRFPWRGTERRFSVPPEGWFLAFAGQE